MGAYLGANQINIFGGQTTGGATINNQDKSVTPSESSQSITADAGYTGLGTVTVNAVSSTYVGSGIDRCDSSDLTVSGDTVTVPSGYYENGGSKVVSSGTAGTPSASKGTVSSHSIAVTPSVTNTTGYITGGTKTGTAVTVSASELVSGTYSVASSGTADVTNYASISVPSGTAGTPSATKGTVSSNSITVTPSVTNTSGYITGSTITGTPVTVSASELVSGSETKTANGTYDVTNLASLIVNVSGGGGDTWSWMGKNPTKLVTLANDKVYLKDTSFATWTPSTSSKTIASSSSLTKQTLDLTSNDFVLLCLFHSHLEYNAGTTGTAMITDLYSSYWQMVYPVFSSLSSMTNNIPNTATYQNSTNILGGFFYKDSSGNDKYINTPTSGVYISSMQAPTTTGTASEFDFTAKKPAVNAKCSNTYFSTANCALVNQNTSYYEMKMELWRVDSYTTPYGALYKIDRDMWINGI